MLSVYYFNVLLYNQQSVFPDADPSYVKRILQAQKFLGKLDPVSSCVEFLLDRKGLYVKARSGETSTDENGNVTGKWLFFYAIQYFKYCVHFVFVV